MAITKCDLVDDELQKMIAKELKKELKGVDNLPVHFISAATQFGISKLKDEIMRTIDKK